MAQYTPHYGLHQWEPEDSFLREDFNQDLARIDAALGQMSGFVCGSFTGNGGTQEISLGFRPRLLIMVEDETSHKMCMAADGLTYDYICFTDTGFQVTYNSTYVYIGNRRSTTYTYLVLR